MNIYNWNPVFNIVMNIKKDYINKFNDNNMNFKTWLEKLNKEEYNNIFSCLQLNQEGNILLIRYGLDEMQKGMWDNPNSIYRECRSIVIDLENEELVLTPFRKFFNLNEVEENKIDKVREEIKNAKYIEITNKLDGSMQSARWYHGEVFMAGSMAINPENSWRLEDGYNMLTEKHIKMIKEFPIFTFIFEYISKKDAHVVKYNKEDEGLYLIGIRDVTTGTEFDYNTVKIFADTYNIKCTDIENISFDECLNQMKKYRADEKEGWVINIDGHKMKLKCDDYVFLHRTLSSISSINNIIKTIADGKDFDDLLSKIPDSHKDRIIEMRDNIYKYLKNINKAIDILYKLSSKDNRKEFMIWVDNKVPNGLKGYVKDKYLKNDINILSNGKQGYKKISEIEKLNKISLDVLTYIDNNSII